MIPREILKKIRQIEIRTNRLVSETLAGQYHSVFKGQGMNFDEVREYQPGDDVRAIFLGLIVAACSSSNETAPPQTGAPVQVTASATVPATPASFRNAPRGSGPLTPTSSMSRRSVSHTGSDQLLRRIGMMR